MIKFLVPLLISSGLCNYATGGGQTPYNSVFYLAQEYRTANGYGNNKAYPQWGVAWTPFLRKSAPYWVNQPNERYVSNNIGYTKWHKISKRSSVLSQALGNLIVHDISLIK